MNFYQCLLQKNDCYIANKYITPTRIVVHSTGANNTAISRYVQPHSSQTTGMKYYYDGKSKDLAKSDLISLLGTNKYANDWNRSGIGACVHAFIGKLADGSIATCQTLPWRMRPWGCASGSNGSFNNCAIQFEICEDSTNDKDYLAKVYKEAVALCAHLCKAYSIEPSMIVSHKEACSMGYASNHGDVEHWWSKHNYTMAQFRADVKSKMWENDNAITSTTSTTNNNLTTEEQNQLYRVQVGAYKVKDNAEAMLSKLKSAGFSGFIKSSDGLYRVQVGAYSQKANANAMLSKLKAAGFDGFIKQG